MDEREIREALRYPVWVIERLWASAGFEYPSGSNIRTLNNHNCDTVRAI